MIADTPNRFGRLARGAQQVCTAGLAVVPTVSFPFSGACPGASSSLHCVPRGRCLRFGFALGSPAVCSVRPGPGSALGFWGFVFVFLEFARLPVFSGLPDDAAC